MIPISIPAMIKSPVVSPATLNLTLWRVQLQTNLSVDSSARNKLPCTVSYSTIVGTTKE